MFIGDALGSDLLLSEGSVQEFHGHVVDVRAFTVMDFQTESAWIAVDVDIDIDIDMVISDGSSAFLGTL